MSSTTLTLDGLKNQAKRMRDHFAQKNIDISHSQALETLAKQHGFKDWNILSATLKRQSQMPTWPGIDDDISGTYLGHAFTGKVIKTQATYGPSMRRYTIVFDEPIDVVASKYFSSYRQRINCFLDQSLKSVSHKGLPDNIVQLN